MSLLIESDITSARGLNEVRKRELYQTEVRVLEPTNENLDIVVDYNKYREMQDKLDKIILSRSLYENKRD